MLGTLGSLATLGGTLIPGAQWLTPLGLGMGAANAAQNGNAIGALQAMGNLSKWSPFLTGGWGNPWQR